MEFDEFDSHLAQQQGKPFYVPEQQELLLWSDPYYFHKPNEYWALQKWIESEFAEVSREYAEGFVSYPCAPHNFRAKKAEVRGLVVGFVPVQDTI